MSNQDLKIVRIEDLPLGGFAGIVERKMVLSPEVWQEAQSDKSISHGLGDFIYLANGHFKPSEGVPIHPHQDVDIVSVILNGSVGHKGTLGDGTEIEGPGVQVQRAGTGMRHAEFNLKDTKADIIQIWFLPPTNGLEPAYQNFKLEKNQLTTVLGSNDDNSFDSKMTCQVGYVAAEQVIRCEQPFVALITEGNAVANGISVKQGDLFEGNSLDILSKEDFGLVIIHENLSFTN